MSVSIGTKLVPNSTFVPLGTYFVMSMYSQLSTVNSRTDVVNLLPLT
jgi:hypothetical protein